MTANDSVQPARQMTQRAPAQLVVTTDASGIIKSGTDRWPGAGAYRARTLGELVHEHNHDLIDRIVRELGDHGRLDHGVGVQVRTADGWGEALATAVANDGAVQWQFVPALPDPLREVVAAVTSGRDVTLALGPAVDAVPSEDLWLSVHYGGDDLEGSAQPSCGGFDRMIASQGRDTFRRAVEALMLSEERCPWDQELPDGPVDLGLDEFGDGLILAGPRAGIRSCRLVPISAVSMGNAACLAVWSEGPSRLELPENHLAIQRVAASLELIFHQAESVRLQKRLASRDQLTELFNRRAFFEELERSGGDGRHAVFLIDIDNFRAVNEWHGYAAGDMVLSEFANRLREVVRPGDFVARLSGDEFGAVCADVADDRAIAAIADRVMATCAETFRCAGSEVDLSVSVGAAVSTDDRTGLQQFESAERALLEAKAGGMGTWRSA